MRHLLFVFILFTALNVSAQTYKPTVESLDSRPVPQWFQNAKFGLFIHWGVYAVPGWSPKGQYSEWYQAWLKSKPEVLKYHESRFGDRSYYDLANDFKAELFNPAEWAKLFEKSGVKYIVLTSKHHDGYALWPSKEASNAWGFKWNSSEIGPKRDLLGDLFKEVKKTSVHAGLYYSLYEWYNPLYKYDLPKYVDRVMMPQMKELVTKYEPDVFWTDGDWDATAEQWKTFDFLTWLYNETPVKDRIVTYDRWGAGWRFNHGGVYSPEYQPDMDFEDHYFEESRGMGHSYGYNREEDSWDYNSTQSLVIALIDKVSRGGNFLLDIGPDEHGKIPPIMQDRLLEIGDWLKINGEAIYGSSKWLKPVQWTEGKRDYKAKHMNGIENPEPGYAARELFFTYNVPENNLYAIFPRYPSDKKLVIKDVVLPADVKISFLSTQQNLSWTQQGNNLVVNLPDYDPNKIKAPYGYTIKMEGYGKFAKKPSIAVTYNDMLQPTVTITTKSGTVARYTTDGSEPSEKSPLYEKPIVLNNTTVVKTKSFSTSPITPGNTVSIEVVKYNWTPAVKTGELKTGINYRYYEPSGKVSMKTISEDKPAKTGITNTISLKEKKRKDKFALAFDGYIKIEKDGLYTFTLKSDDGSNLLINETEIIKEHFGEAKGSVALRKGYHKITTLYFDSGGANNLSLSMQLQNGEIEVLSTQLYH